jgi:D-ala D-ala ligase C-terminus
MTPRALREASQALASIGVTPLVVEFSPDRVADLLNAHGPMAVLNLVYGYTDRGGLRLSQPETSELIERSGLRPAGSPFVVQRLTQDKIACGEFLSSNGYRVPTVVRDPKLSPNDLLVRKPRYGAAHRGVAIVTACEVEQQPQEEEVFYEEYVGLPEYTVGVVETPLGIECLPPLRLDCPVSSPCVLSKGADWKIIPDLRDALGLREVALKIFKDLGMRDYARIDLRAPQGDPVILDVNSLPNLDRSRSYLPIAAAAAGWQYAELLNAITRRVLG